MSKEQRIENANKRLKILAITWLSIIVIGLIASAYSFFTEDWNLLTKIIIFFTIGSMGIIATFSTIEREKEELEEEIRKQELEERLTKLEQRQEE